jgi:2-methylcitrate dehydratase PrpD
VAPLVLDLCNKKELRQGLDSKYSIYHAAALGLVRGKAGIQEFSDAAASDPVLASIRERVIPVGDPAITEDQSDVTVELEDGQTLHRFIECSLGNVKRPLSDRQLEEKFRDQAGAVSDRVIEMCWRFEELRNVGDLVRATL